MKKFYQKKRSILFGIIIVILNQGCSIDKNSLNPSSNNLFEIYFLADSTLEFKNVLHVPIAKLKISYVPVITCQDIEFYKIFNFSEIKPLSHSIIFKSNVRSKFGKKNRPFLLIADAERIYIGDYWANFMSTYPPEIFIYPYSDSVFHIMSFDNGPDKINDERIFTALNKAGIKIEYIN